MGSRSTATDGRVRDDSGLNFSESLAEWAMQHEHGVKRVGTLCSPYLAHEELQKSGIAVNGSCRLLWWRSSKSPYVCDTWSRCWKWR